MLPLTLHNFEKSNDRKLIGEFLRDNKLERGSKLILESSWYPLTLFYYMRPNYQEFLDVRSNCFNSATGIIFCSFTSYNVKSLMEFPLKNNFSELDYNKLLEIKRPYWFFYDFDNELIKAYLIDTCSEKIKCSISHLFYCE
jgi:hypothetical protein